MAVSVRPLAIHFLAVSLAAGSLASRADESRQRWQQDIAGGYRQLVDASTSLAEAATSYCAAPDNNRLSQVQHAWQAAFWSWQRVRFVDFGPIEHNSLAWQFQFWPDAKNLVARKVNHWLSQEGDLNSHSIAAASVAIQGFPALEYLLWDPRFQQTGQALPAERSCVLLTAISQHIVDNTDALASQWQAMAPFYESNERYTTATVQAAMTAIEVIRDRRLGAPMGLRGNDRRNPYQADAWRSETSLAAVRASLEGLQTLFLPGMNLELSMAGTPELQAKLTARFSETLANFDQLPDGMTALLAGEGYGKLQALYIDVELLEQLLTDDIATTLGIVRGFNASDGD